MKSTRSWLLLLLTCLTLSSACSTAPASPIASHTPLNPGTETLTPALTSAPAIAASPDLAATEEALPRLTALPSPIFVATATVAGVICPGAPGPYAAIGSQVTVVTEDNDKLKLRSEPTVSYGKVIRELNQYTQLQVVDGPRCFREAGASYWFWQVKVLPNGETGWVAEGDARHSFIVVSVGKQYLPSTATADIGTTSSACLGPHAPFLDGTKVIVIAENSDKLKLRSEPKISPDTVTRELDQFTSLQIVGTPMCVTAAESGISYWLWKVKVISSGKTGWVSEGDGTNYFIASQAP